MRHMLFAAAVAALASSTSASPVIAPPQPLAPDLQRYIRLPAGHIALVHVRVIDGTGAPAADDQTVLIDGPRIAAVQAASASLPQGYQSIDLAGATVFPGLVGMHN